MIQKVKISKVLSNPVNPRTIQKDKFQKLVKSIKEFPEMLELRPIVVNSEMVVIGGNMRFRACQELGLKEVFIIKAENLTEAQIEQFIIKDNISSGEWDWDILANDWQSSDLNEWGLGVWESKDEITAFKPVMFPSQSDSEVTDKDVEKGADSLGSTFQKGTEKKFIETMCPNCGHEFNVAQE
jgi:hypothetical protein|tara:strand:+ start:49 stop:597 length:549 start_codon:yes stop_codon:yes gene_type:complete